MTRSSWRIYFFWNDVPSDFYWIFFYIIFLFVFIFIILKLKTLPKVFSFLGNFFLFIFFYIYIIFINSFIFEFLFQFYFIIIIVFIIFQIFLYPITHYFFYKLDQFIIWSSSFVFRLFTGLVNIALFRMLLWKNVSSRIFLLILD